MNEQNWRSQRNSRSLCYAGRVLDPNHWILLRASEEYAERYDGQVAILTAANLLGRMSPAVALDVPSVPLVDSLTYLGSTLPEVVLNLLSGIDPYGKFCCRSQMDNDYVIHLGRTGATNLVHGSGWNLYCGPSPSPLVDDDFANPIGPALAVILAISEAFRTNLTAPRENTLFNALTWKAELLKPEFDPLSQLPKTLGTLWTVGTGSVGTAILYFLSLATQKFSTVLFDMDVVKIHNLDRSPIFTVEDLEKKKVLVTKRYLDQARIKFVKVENCALDESELWRNRTPGTPDLIISTANERNVRTVIENGYPPIQIYGTTGRNWQASVIRHIPLIDPCSTCLFPNSIHKSTSCAAGSITVEREGNEEQIDAALPFLSFAAGAMAAAEILKLCFPSPRYNITDNRIILNTLPVPGILSVPLSSCDKCICRLRSAVIHRKMIEGSRFAELSV